MNKIAVIYGEYSTGLQKKAIEVLSKFLIEYTFEYPICVPAQDIHVPDDCTRIYIGTKNNNPYIKDNSSAKFTHDEEYYICVKDGTVMIEGFDDAGVLYGCIDFYNKYIVKYEYTDNDEMYWKNPFSDELENFEYGSYPSIKNRGIWTWGHVIYDYKGFIDNMAMLKMNTVTIWNDEPPVNAREIVEYAHSAGIKVIWGYSWFWDTECGKIDISAVNEAIDDIIKKYEKDYLPLGGDGIYFQSFTELNQEYIGDKLIAEAVTDFVNTASQKLLKKHPNLELQFGLHATSVREKLEYIEKVNPKVRIVWENCGAFPFAYIPKETDNFTETLDFVKKISALRGKNDKFGAVTKGLTKLDWNTFEHLPGQIFTGVSFKTMKENRLLRKNKIWRYLQAYWLTNADKAQEMIQLMHNQKNGNLYITALIEDGMFEEKIMFPAALFSEIMWDCNKNIKEMINEVALRKYIEFA